MKRNLTYLLVLLTLNAIGQNKRILAFDLINGSVDTLEWIDTDTSLIKEHTAYYLGNINEAINDLDEGIPYENIYPESNYTKKRPAALDYNINDFPIRTSVKLFSCTNDSLQNHCSGSLISSRHVLSARHCMAPIDTNIMLFDSIYASPVYDNGQFNSLFNGSWVQKVYVFQDRDFRADFSVLELAEPIGLKTGWISIGYDAEEDSLRHGIFYKFSYPSITLLPIDSNQYNGDTLYYGYGLANIIEPHFILISNTSGIPGESGSSLIKVENGAIYTSYGVASMSANLRHSRLTRASYFPIKSIIKNDLNASVDQLNLEEEIFIYPNPTQGMLHIHLKNEYKNSKLRLMNMHGQVLRDQDNNKNDAMINLSDLPNQSYLLIIESKQGMITRKIIKNGSEE